MDVIELERRKRSESDPRRLEYAGQPIAQEVFDELKYRLDSMGCLPDEYFLMGDEWENGREIPKDADIFCTVDYGESEGVYLDVYLKWHQDGKPITKSFITGKTLGENGNDLDRMYLTASAVTKAFHGDHATHSRYMKIDGVEEDTGGRVVHLSQQEEKVIINALMEQRERQAESMSQTEQLLRRMTGSITAYMDAVGHMPLHMSGCDRAVLAIRDGELDAFLNLYPKLLDTHADSLLVETAGRPGNVGRSMIHFLLDDVERFSEQAYCAACQKAIDINDPRKVAYLLANAADRVAGLSPSFHGEMASYAYADHRHIAKEIIKQCTSEQIAAAPPRLLAQFAGDRDYRTMSTLVEKGISGGPDAWQILHMLTFEGHDSWMAEDLLKKQMWVDPCDYGALRTCVENNAAAVGKLLLDQGMDLDQYKEWAKRQSHGLRCNDTLTALEEHWNELQTQTQEIEGPQIGGMDLG